MQQAIAHEEKAREAAEKKPGRKLNVELLARKLQNKLKRR
jgi:hypothetical protein